MTIPCKDCITLSICRHKYYIDMFQDCYLIFDYLPDFNHAAIRDEEKLILLFRTLKPKSWILRPIRKEELKETHDEAFKDKLMVINIEED